MEPKIAILVPAFNEEENIISVIDSLHQYNPNWHIIVINDASQDSTSNRARSTDHAVVLDLPCNLGIGGCIETGFKYAAHNNFDIAIQFDGDGQHIASEIPSLIQPLKNNEADVVIGSRFMQDNKSDFQSTRIRRIGINIFKHLNSILIRQKITDNTSGFRAYNQTAFRFLSHSYPTDYPEPEAIILLGKNKFRIKEIPAEMLERNGGTSSIGGLKSIYYMIKVIAAVLIASTRSQVRI